MNKVNENRPGYMNTKVGWIPEEWQVEKLGSILRLSSGKVKPPIFDSFHSPSNTENTIPVYGGNGIMGYTNKPNTGDEVIVIGRVGEYCGSVHVVKQPLYITDNALYTINWYKEKLIDFFGYLLQYKKLNRLRNKGGQPLISQKPIYNMCIPLPPLPEQKKIAEILSTWDEAIEKLEKLIELKERRKKGLMQQLLTGKKRLPGFGNSIKKDGEIPEGWERKNLIDICDIRFSNVDKKKYKGQQNILLCNYMDVYKNDYITKDINFMEATASDSEISKFTLKPYDVMITKDSETPDDIGIPSVVLDNLGNVLCGYHLALLRPKDKMIDGIFLSKKLSEPHVSYLLSTHANGATRFGLSTKSIKNIEITIPPIKEQFEIRKILLEHDKNIELILQKTSYIKQQKKGLMQKLLTGEVRVKN